MRTKPKPKPSEILFTGLHRQKMTCGGYEVTGNPVTVRLGPKKNLPKDVKNI